MVSACTSHHALGRFYDMVSWTDAHFSGIPDAPHHASERPKAEASARSPDAASLLAKPGT